MVLLDYGFCGCGVCSALVPQVCVWCLVLVGFFDSRGLLSGFDSGFMLRCGGCGWCDCGWFPMIMVGLVFVVFLVWCLGCGWLRLLV